MSFSSTLADIYRSLPAEAQRVLVEKHLVQLLDHVPKQRARKIISTANRIKNLHSGIPVLDLKAKKAEINGLLDDLRRDSKSSLVTDASNVDELLNETIQSLFELVNTVWSVVYEYNTNFLLAHSCLLYVIEVVDKLRRNHCGCRCLFMRMFVAASLKNNCGKIIKSFSFTGGHHFDQVLLWVWRDLFVSLLAAGDPREKNIIPEMLGDLEEALGWHSLVRLLYGGKKLPTDEEGEDDDEEDDDDDDEPFEDHDCDIECDHYGRQPWFPLHSCYWSKHINNQSLPLRNLVQDRLTSVFKVTPSLSLFNCLLSISAQEEGKSDELLNILSSIATDCSESFATALDIYSYECDKKAIITLLDSHSHLLRPQDARMHQSAIAVLAMDPFFIPRCLRTIEKELLETIRSISVAISVCFRGVGEQKHQDELTNIIKMRQGCTSRHDRVHQWVEAVITPGLASSQPMTLAAMMMGFPVGGALADDNADPTGYLDVDPTDIDLEDLREELRPRLRQTFEGWAALASSFNSGRMALVGIYDKLVELMPFMRASDAVDEMISRLADTPSKHYVCDALEALSAFSKLQRKKLSAVPKKTQKKKTHHSNPAGPSVSNVTSPAPFEFDSVD